MKKIISLLVVIVMIATMATTAFAAKAGDTVTVTFATKGNPDTGFASYGAVINYPAEALVLEKVESLQSGAFQHKNGKIGFSTSENITGEVELFVATFKVAEDAKAGEYKVTATLDAAATVNADLEAVVFEIVGGVVTVEGDHVHVYTETIKNPTCVEDGAKVYTCECGDSYTEVIDALGHLFKDNWEHKNDPNKHFDRCVRTDCGGDICTCDGYEKVGYHNFVLKEKVETDAEGGTNVKSVYVCDVCGYQREDIDWIPGTGDITPVIVASVVAVIAVITLAGYMLKRKFAL